MATRSTPGRRWDRLVSAAVLLTATALGAWFFAKPFLVPAASPDSPSTAGLFFALLGLCLAVVVANLETRRLDGRLLAALGILVGLNATLRLISGPAGLSAVFFVPILCGFVFGADFGFLLGTLSLLVSALLAGGVGPWLPFQMLAAGWSGMVAGWLPRWPESWKGRERWEAVMLAIWGAASGLAFGAVMNLWFWPFLAGPAAGPEGAFEAGAGAWETLRRYVVFYVATSLWWDLGRAAGNVLFLILVGPPVLRLLRRFETRFRFTVEGG